MIELWKAFVIAALAVASVEMLKLNTEMQRQNAYQQGKGEQLERELQWHKGHYRNAF